MIAFFEAKHFHKLIDPQRIVNLTITSMSKYSLSVVLLTRGQQPLMKYTIESIIHQIDSKTEFIISINTNDESNIKYVMKMLDSFDHKKNIKIISTGRNLQVYEHYRFATEACQCDNVLIIHDDDIYHSSAIRKIRQGFEQDNVNVVVGGMLKTELYENKIGLSYVNLVNDFGTKDGVSWLMNHKDFYPKFCYSAVAFRRNGFDMNTFSKKSTAADCLLVAMRAMSGNVYETGIVLATWLQLPNRTSRWAAIDHRLIPAWQEFLTYYLSTENETLIRRAKNGGRKSLIGYIKMLFIVAVRNRNNDQILGALKNIGLVSPSIRKILEFTLRPCVINIFSPICQIIFDLRRSFHSRKFKARIDIINAEDALEISNELWTSYITEATKQAKQ